MAWEDVSVGFSDMPAELGGADGRKVRMDITGSDWGVQVDTVNGASVTRVVGGAFDGTDCIKIVPPSGSTSNPNQTYSCIMRGLDLSDGGSKNVAQVNLGFCVRWASRYIDLGAQAKVTGIVASQSVGGDPNASASRAAIFEAKYGPNRIFSITATTCTSYHDPVDGIYPEDGSDANKPVFLGTTINHGASPPRMGQEWVYIEQEVDYRQNRGNPNGLNRMDIYFRDGTHRHMEIGLDHREECGASWDFSYQYGRMIEYIGALWNDASVANANNYLEVSHPIVSVNRAKYSRIGPPDEFLGGEGGDDTTPNAFSFTDQTGVARSSTITSAAITVSGIDAAATISVTGGTYDVNGSGTFVSTSGTVDNGDTVRARHTSSASYSTATNTVVTIGGVSDTFTSTTESNPGDTTPTPFTFTDQADVARSTVITSAAITVAGIDAPTTISVSGGTYDINSSGTFVSTPGTVSVGDTVRARHTSSSSYSAATNTVVTIGGVSDTFTSTTEDESDWTAHDISYLPIVPGAAGACTDQYGGSGRHLGGSNEAAIFFVDDRGTGSSGSWDSVTRIGYGTTKWCADHPEYGHVVWLVNGLLDYTGGGSRNIQVSNDYKTFHAHTAPGDLAYRGALWAISASHLCFRHLAIYQDLYPEGEGDQADCTNILTATDLNSVLWDNCFFAYNADEAVDAFRKVSKWGLWQCIVANALTDGNHPEGVHNYGVIIGDETTEALLARTIVANCRARFPLSYAPSLSILNCLMYNWTDDATQIAGDDAVTDTNVESNLYITGPDTTGDRAIRLYSSLLEGSRAYVSGNRGFGIADEDLLLNSAGLSLSGSRLTSAFPTGFGVTPISDRQAFAELLMAHAGPKPTSRSAKIQDVLDTIANELAGTTPRGSYPATPTSPGFGYPSITNGSVLDPSDPGSFWGGVPCPMDLATRNQVMPSGYTRFEEWSNGVAGEFMPAGWDGGSGGGGDDTTPNAFSFTDQTGVSRSITITSASITVSGIDAAAIITVSGGQYSINGGSFTSSAGTVESGDTVRARHTSSGSYSTATNTVVTIGGVSDTFTTITESEITIPAGRWFRVPRR